MSIQKGAFEQKLIDSFEHYELPYMPSSWTNLERRLDKKTPSDYSRLVAATAAAVLISAGALVYYFNFQKLATAESGFKIARFENNNSTIKQHNSDKSENADTLTSDASQSLTNEALTKTNYTINLPSEGASPEPKNSGVAREGQQVVSPVNPSVSQNNTGGNNLGGTNLMVQASVDKACAGTEVVFEVTNGPKEGSYLWNFGDGDFSNKPNPHHKYTKPGVYDVSLSVTNKKDGHIKTTVMDDFITINPSPVADFDWEFVNGSLEEPTVKIINTSDNASSYQWKFEDGSKSKAISPVRSYSEKGKQMVALEVSNEYGCTDGKVKYIAINKDYNLMAPERFSPTQETFMPEGLKQGKLNFKMTIYHGEKAIFESSSKNRGWDGTLPDGSIATPGSQFPWIVIISNETTKEEKYFSGLVTVNP